jgi:hypothetical protein
MIAVRLVVGWHDGGVDVVLELSAVIVAVRDDVPYVLTVLTGDKPGLPSGVFDPDADRSLDRAMRRWANERTGLQLGFVEQLYTFGDFGRDPVASRQGERRISLAYLAFVRDGEPLPELDAMWTNAYELLPWEDRRLGEPELVSQQIAPALASWVDAALDHDQRNGRALRADLSWGLAGAAWDPVRVLERYELLFEVGLIGEVGKAATAELGVTATLDHRRILASALGRVRGKLTYRPVVFELLPSTFTLLQLQRVVESLVGEPLHKQNFRRLVEGGGLVEGTGHRAATSSGRPAELFRFRREVLRERPAPGLGLPGRR